ncbi:kinase phosphorylation protein [Drechmeria coniospora]|uniref:Kinase phosphorylation protein n=1 Tax=Drechmeria coniospora TaxID=98403 RepID=A0A151GWX9_DRECN|nr:kinase phosphorylation protein [Drechmeria coniospora]KYK61553.1 kinase phosphorylation protein [Drechmeria coniospora]ODA79812.1 hypothetical protein RJ55_05408 [Drechmeria coniospora]
MDLLAGIRKTGSRGGVNFSWDEIATSTHRENYLGHSLKAPVGRWQKGKDLNWYAKADLAPADGSETVEEREERERKEEIRRVKEAEEDALARALGLPPPQRTTSGANAVEVGIQRHIGPSVSVSEDTETRTGGIDGDTEVEAAEGMATVNTAMAGTVEEAVTVKRTGQGTEVEMVDGLSIDLVENVAEM